MIRFAGNTGKVLQLNGLEPINVSDAYYRRYHRALDDYKLELGKKALKVEIRRFMQNHHIHYPPKVG